MFYFIFKIFMAACLGFSLGMSEISYSNWKFWFILIIVAALSVLNYKEGLQRGMEMVINAGF